MTATMHRVSARPATALQLQIALLGPPMLVWNGQPLPLPRRQARALLYRLAASAHPVPRDQLCFLLWPDSPEAAARRNLTVLLTQLRHALPHPDTLVTVGDALALDQARVQVDVVTASARIAQALRDEQTEDLADALRFYRGPFLHGFALPDAAEFDAWVEQERQVWERKYLDGLATLVERFSANGDYPAAIEAAQRALATDELAEEMHRTLIELYGALGERSAALRQFERCVVVLERELGVDPLPQTRAAYEAVRDGKLHSRLKTPIRPQPLAASIAQPAADLAQLREPPNTLIGRDSEVAAIGARLRRADVRLLTLCGPGGSGKTRLALRAAHELRASFADGVVVVSLAPLRDPGQLVDAIAQACGLHLYEGAPTRVQLRDHLRDKQLLLILDNFEHLLAAAPLVADLLAAAPRLSVLVTSRSVLNLQGEHSFQVLPLPLPDLERLPPPEELAEQPAVALLLARTRAHTPAFQINAANAVDLASICCQLDGLPLAIELAAARLKILSPQALLKRLDHRLALLDRGPRDLPDRHRTLRATIAWSERLLDLEAQHLFERLAVFAGGWTLAAAEQICGADASGGGVLDDLQALIDANLVVLDGEPGDERRFRMLETIREYALERLRERDDEWSVRRRHAHFYCASLEQHAPGLGTSGVLPVLAAIDQEYHNIRLALQWALEAGESALAARIFTSLLGYWDLRGLIREGSSWAAQVVPLAAALPQPLRAHVNANAGMLAYRQGEPQAAAELAAAALAASETSEEIASAAQIAGLAALELGDGEAARRHFVRHLVLAEEHGLIEHIAVAHLNLGLMALARRELAEAEAHFQHTYASYAQLGLQPSIGVALVALGFTALLQGDVRRASRLLYDALEKLNLVREKTMMLYGLLACCGIARLQQQPLLAATLYGAALRQAERAGVRIGGPVWALAQEQIDAVRAALSAEAFEQAYQEGRARGLEAAVALALALLEAMMQQDEAHAAVGVETLEASPIINTRPRLRI